MEQPYWWPGDRREAVSPSLHGRHGVVMYSEEKDAADNF